MYRFRRLVNGVLDTYEVLAAQSQFKADMWMRTVMCLVLITLAFITIIGVMAVRFLWAFIA